MSPFCHPMDNICVGKLQAVDIYINILYAINTLFLSLFQAKDETKSYWVQ